MPPVADIPTSNLAPDVDQDNVQALGRHDPEGQTRPHGKAPTHMASNRRTSTGPGSRNDGGNSQPETSRSVVSETSKQTHSNDGLLHIPDDATGLPRRPPETSIWDWDTPLDSIGESSSYYYEPQGELLQESRDSQSASTRKEFMIPTAISDSTIAGQHGGGTAWYGHDGFAIPRKPSAPSVQAIGAKRKSTSDRDPTDQDRGSGQKRVSQTMAEPVEESSLPEDARPPAHSTRSQSRPAARGRSITDVSEARPRPGTTGSEALRSGSALRRTLTDPSTPMVLPARKVFPIQIGDKLFRLSGASISSDGNHHLPAARE